MSTMSNSRAEAILFVTAMAFASLTAGCAAAGASESSVAPDAPLPAIAEPPRTAPNHYREPQPLELDSARLIPVSEELMKYAGPEFARTARAPMAVEARTSVPFDLRPRTSSPMLIVNGRSYPDTWAFAPDRLVAFLPDASVLRDVNEVEAAWVGAETETRSRRKVTLSRADRP